MSIWPDDCNCIITFFFDFTGKDLGIDLLFFDEHCTRKFIDTECAFTIYSEGIWIYSLFYAFLFDNDLSLSRIVEDEYSLNLFQQLLCYFCA